MELGQQSDAILKEKDAMARELLDNITKARRNADTAKEEAQIAYDKAAAARNLSRDMKVNVDDLIDKITTFLEDDSANPQAIRFRAQQVSFSYLIIRMKMVCWRRLLHFWQTLEKDIKLKPEEIKELAKQINDTIASLTNIDAILAATKETLEDAEKLKGEADEAK